MNRYLDALAFSREDIIAFGSFQLNRTTRILTNCDSPVALGSRAMEILLALTEKAGAILSNRELLDRVWPSLVVEDGRIRVHMALLRKALRKADPESDYVHNVNGRGYRFVAPITRQRGPGAAPLEQMSGRNTLPLRITSIFGREQTIRTLTERVLRERFMTVTGPGGSGKTTVALGAADALVAAHANGVCFVDLAEVRRAEQIWAQVGTSLGMAPAAERALPEILEHLSKQSLLMMLDNCEHVIEGARLLTESVLGNCPQVSILATSREPMRARGEGVLKLTPLELPLASDEPTRSSLLKSPAIQLFVARASAYADAGFDDEELSLVGNVCRRLAGNPLAIEIAASQVRWMGLKSLATSVYHAMYLSFEGRRTGARRQQTLRASFDWSFDLLSPEERAVFRRLSVFAGSFPGDRAAGLISDEHLTHQVVHECLASLARRSLIIAEARQEGVVCRLDHQTRAYAEEKLHEAHSSHPRIAAVGAWGGMSAWSKYTAMPRL